MTSAQEAKVKIKEAELYQSMGLFDEALSVYHQVHAELGSSDGKVRQFLDKRIKQLLRKIEAAERQTADINLSPQERALISTEGKEKQDIGPILDRASAYKEQGYYAEAAAEYERLFALNYPGNIVVPELVGCLIKHLALPQLLPRIGQIVEKTALPEEKRAALYYYSGVELERHGLTIQAYELVDHARQMDPSNRQVFLKQNQILNRLAEQPVWQHLIARQLVYPQQIKKAIILAHKKGQSVAYILSAFFQIDKVTLLKAMADHYGCQWCVFDPQIIGPAEVLDRLDRERLFESGWVPIIADGKIQVLIEDPDDTHQLDEIRNALQSDHIHWAVAVREDIALFIDRFYSNSSPSVTQIDKDAPELQIVDIGNGLELENMRRDVREVSVASELLSAEFDHVLASGESRSYVLRVHNHSRHGLGLLVTPQDEDLLAELQIGNTIENIAFFAGWAMIKVDAIVRHVTPIEKGPDAGQFIVGLETHDLI